MNYNNKSFALIDPFYLTGEGQEEEYISFKELRARVTVLASALKQIGVKKGDRIAGMTICIRTAYKNYISRNDGVVIMLV